MEIYLDRRAIRQIKLAAQDAIDEGDTEACREEILDAFTEEQVEEIERRLDHGDIFEFVTDVLDEWSGEDVDELLELFETQLGEVGLDLKTEAKDQDADDAEEEDDDEDEESAEEEDDAEPVGGDDSDESEEGTFEDDEG